MGAALLTRGLLVQPAGVLRRLLSAATVTKSKSALTLSFFGRWSLQVCLFFLFSFLHIFFLSLSLSGRRLRHSRRRFVCLDVCHRSSVLRAALQTGLRLQVWAHRPLPTPRFSLPFQSLVALCLAVRSPARILFFVPSQKKEKKKCGTDPTAYLMQTLTDPLELRGR